MDSLFHPGELEIQARAGVRDKIADFGARAIRDFMPEQHREFFPLLPWLLVGSADADGQPQASVLWGPPGFAHSPEPRLLRVEASPEADDPLAANLMTGARLGLLGLELPTRRRNRLNGRLTAVDETGFALHVQQSFGNCPKYIQARRYAPTPRTAAPSLQGHGLDPTWLGLAQGSDTLFIASQHPAADNGGVDISHRGGHPGFVQLGADGQLWLPDYRGNHYFNTLGNLALDARCALLFVDFVNGDLLHLEARARIHWPEDAARHGLAMPAGAERLLSLQPGRWTLRPGRLPLRFDAAEASPFLPEHGV